MAWKERFTSRQTRLMRIVGTVAVIAIGVPIAYVAIQHFLLAVDEAATYGMTKDFSWTTRQHRYAFHALIGVTIPFLFFLGFLGVATSAAGSITSEHETDTWTCLTATDLTPREVVVGKLVGALKPGVKFLTLILVLAGMGVGVGATHWLSIPFLAIETVVFMTFAATFGIWISLFLKSTWRAQFLTLALLLLIGIMGQTILNLCNWREAFVPPAWPGFYLAEISHAVLDYKALEQFWDSNPSWRDLSWYNLGLTPLWILVFSATSVVGYSTLSVFLLFDAFRGYDRAAGRPKRPRIRRLGQAIPQTPPPKIENPVTC